jgi:hypothetical protein
VHNYALIKYKYALKKKLIETWKYMQHDMQQNFTFIFYRLPKTNFNPTMQLLLLKEKKIC